jgi:PRTRC genetic system protein E
MFKELVPILRHRAVLMTVTFIDEDQIRVNVVPKKLKDGENNALTTPVTVIGTAEELDAELGPTLVNFVGAHLQLKNTLESAKADMDAAAKAAQAEARSKTKTPPKKDTAQPSAAKPKDDAKPAEPAKTTVPKTASLFDMPAPEAPATPASVPTAAPSDATDEDEDELLDEIKDNEDDDAVEELEEAA